MASVTQSTSDCLNAFVPTQIYTLKQKMLYKSEPAFWSITRLYVSATSEDQARQKGFELFVKEYPAWSFEEWTPLWSCKPIVLDVFQDEILSFTDE